MPKTQLFDLQIEPLSQKVGIWGGGYQGWAPARATKRQTNGGQTVTAANGNGEKILIDFAGSSRVAKFIRNFIMKTRKTPLFFHFY